MPKKEYQLPYKNIIKILKSNKFKYNRDVVVSIKIFIGIINNKRKRVSIDTSKKYYNYEDIQLIAKQSGLKISKFMKSHSPSKKGHRKQEKKSKGFKSGKRSRKKFYQ